MSRWLALALVVLAASPAIADDVPTEVAATEPATASEPASEPTMGGLGKLASAASSEDDLGDQGLGAMIGIATGGRVTAGGLRLEAHYLYQMSTSDWFDGTASFTYGGGGAGCFRDRMDLVVCDHGLADGGAIEVQAGVRRMLAKQGKYRPFARAAIGVTYVRFGDDDVSGFAVPLHLGAGLRTRVASGVAIVGLAELAVGLGTFGRGLGAEPQLGLAVTAGAEFRLR